MRFDLHRRLAAEALGTAILVGTVVGSGIMADRLTNDGAMALLGNTIPTWRDPGGPDHRLGPVSGAHFNPAVTLAFALRREIARGDALAYVAVQVLGGIAGPIAHAMFELPILQISQTVRTGPGQWLAEGRRDLRPRGRDLRGCASGRSRSLAGRALHPPRLLVYRFARRSPTPLSPSPEVCPTRIRADPALDVPAFVGAELIGSLLAVSFFTWLLEPRGGGSKRERGLPVLERTAPAA